MRRHVAQRPHRPNDKGFQSLFAAQVLQDLHDRPDTRREHHAEDQDDHDVLDAVAYGSDYQQHGCRTYPRSSGNAYRRTYASKYHERHAEARTRTDAEHVGSCQRVAEQRLHLQSADRQRRTRQQGYHGFYKPYVHHNFHGRMRTVAARQCRPHVSNGDTHSTDGQIQQKKTGRKCRQCGKEYGRAGAHLFHTFLSYKDIVKEVATCDHNLEIPFSSGVFVNFYKK